MRIATRRLLLRPPRREDIDDIVAGVGDFAVAGKLARVPHPYRRADAEDWLGRVGKSMAAGTDVAMMIVRDGRAVGNVGVHAIPLKCELGYWLARDHWGEGYATEATEALLAYCFGTLRLPLVRSGVFVDNPASLRVQLKLGFRRVGASRRLCLARGRPVAHIDTVLTRGRFREAGR